MALIKVAPIVFVKLKFLNKKTLILSFKNKSLRKNAHINFLKEEV